MWVDYIQTYLDKVEGAETPEEYHRQMVKVAALAVAAIESRDRMGD